MRLGWKYIRHLLMAGGVVFFLLLAACWSPYPYRIYAWLSMPDAVLTQPPQWIVVLGGGGIPSESGLMRTYYAAQAAATFPDADVVIALPGDPGRGSVRMMKEELVLRGVAPARIRFEPKGTNTRSQAVEWSRLIGPMELHEPLLIVTSPEHMRRSIRSFQRAGFSQVGSSAAMDTTIDGPLFLSEEGLDSRFAVERIEQSLFIRYQFWHGISYMTRSMRELVALAYYRAKGWI